MNMMMFRKKRDDFYLKLHALLLPSGSPIMALLTVMTSYEPYQRSKWLTQLR